jgi:hypothetical protein
MYKITDREFDTLAQAIEFAKSVKEFVVIAGEGIEIVGHFGVDSVKNGVCPSGVDYTWKKRRL